MDALAAGHDAAVQMIDTSVVRVHQHGACISDNNHQAMGRSRGGLTSKIHAVDTNGLPVHLALTPGEAHDNRLCSVLLSALLPQTMLLADHRLQKLHDFQVTVFFCGHQGCLTATSEGGSVPTTRKRVR